MTAPDLNSTPEQQKRSSSRSRNTFGLTVAAVVLVIALVYAQYADLLSLQATAGRDRVRAEVKHFVRWQRIRLRTAKDLDRALPVLIDFVKNPEHALSLKELTFDTRRYDYGSDAPLPPIALPETLSNDEQKVMEAVKAIELGVELEKAIMEALIWKTRGIDVSEAEEAEANPLDYCDPRRFERDNNRRNRRLQYARVLTILFCSLSPNLTILRVTEPEHIFAEFLATVNHRWVSHGTIPIFASLKDVHLIERSEGYSILEDERFYRNINPLETIRYFHRLPSIESFSATTLSSGRSELDHIPPGHSRLRAISVTNSDVGSATMCSLIRLATALENITFTAGGRATNDGSFSAVFPKSLGKCLEQQKATLRSIDIDADCQWWSSMMSGDGDAEDGVGIYERQEDYLQLELDRYREEPEWRAEEEDSKARGLPLLSRDLPDTKTYNGTIGSLADFENLESLKIGIKLLLGDMYGPLEEPQPKPPTDLVDMLPRNLKHLTLRGYRKGERKEYDENVEQLRAVMADKLPLLAEVEGLDEEVPSGEHVEDCDAEDAPLFVMEPVEDGWLEVEPDKSA
ncbi:uncharacterized protein HMPREF1541_09289 [Cyphellophora europaea CBS 101466]|uniref:Uncharacterized protein n=1 Tax=Cyphellophora europaea (strain CBS 101466) TaxID=1220924 RepID=W2S9U9_CYPE1|nr:uncharacterized protein HMPREF1541_09289 [Cyphellophora europaea CBS 101466]ETN45457.1 hypothetical protein HMPREF1541_09289 [Cyphellophora europaea CBS 101466]